MTQKITSIKEARAILGKTGENLTDDQIEKLVSHYTSIISGLLKNFIYATQQDK